VRTTEYSPESSVPQVVDLVDSLSRSYSKNSKHARGIWKVIYPFEHKRLYRYEKEVVEKFDHTYITTKEDAEYINDNLNQISIIPNGVDDNLLNRDYSFSERTDRPKITFLGKMDYFPNEDAVLYFANDIFPEIKKEYPNAQFIIVGMEPTPAVRALARNEDITVTGFVKKPSDYLLDSTLTVAPLRHGAGIQNKVLEAMALGIPTVASQIAKEGIVAEDGTHILVAKNDSEFIDQICNLASDPQKRRHIGTSAKRRISEKYTWETIRPKLLTPITELLS
jgi:glycosyltransferase involved in cell wall biosynthesis